MEIIDFGVWETPEIGTKTTFHPKNGKTYTCVVVAVLGSEVRIERIEDLTNEERIRME